MKQILLPVLAIVATQGLHAQIANGNFDYWTETQLFEHPHMDVETSSSNYETFLAGNVVNVTAVNSVDGQALRLESITYDDKVWPAFFLVGQTPNQSGENVVFGGGMPVTAAGVTGISLDIRHSTPAESPGFVVVQFKKNGVPVGNGNMGPGTMMVSLEGNSDWQNIAIDWEVPFEEQPDMCVVGIASANLFGDDDPYPAGAWVEVDNINFINSSQVFTGGDFETWGAVEPLLTPDGVLLDSNPLEPTFSRTVDAATGMFALSLHTLHGGDNARVGRAIFAEGTLEEPTPYIQLNNNDRSLSFAYKYAAENDKAVARVTFFNTGENGWNNVYQRDLMITPLDDDSEQVNTGLSALSASGNFRTMDYAFADELEAFNVTATHMTIEFMSSVWMENNEPKDGSTLTVDGVMLNGALNNRTLDMVTQRITASPNPTAHRVIFTFNLPRTGFYRVFNQSGQQIDIKEFQSEKQIVYNMAHLKAGLYLFRFQHNAGTDVMRVVKL